MRKTGIAFLALLLIAVLALGQGVTIAPKTTIAANTGVFPGAASGGPTIALIQNPKVTGSSGTTASITLTQPLTTNANHFLVFGVASSTPGGQRILSINVGGTLIPCGSTSSCYIEPGTALPYVDGGWVIGTTATAGPVVVSFSGVSFGGTIVEMREYSCTGGTISADVQGTRDNGTDTNPFSGPTLTLTGTNEVITAWSDGVGVDPTAVSSPYGNFDSANGVGFADHLNTSSGAAASYTAAGNSGGSTSAAIAMKCQ